MEVVVLLALLRTRVDMHALCFDRGETDIVRCELQAAQIADGLVKTSAQDERVSVDASA